MATISLLHERSMRHSDTVNEQLQTALNSRVIIEQAKGKLAERLGLDMDQAFSVLRNHARTRNLLLSDVALRSSTIRNPCTHRRCSRAPRKARPITSRLTCVIPG